MGYSATSDKTKMAYYVIYNILQNDEDNQIKSIEDLREFLNYAIEECATIVEDKNKVEETKGWYKKAIELTNEYSFEQLKEAINQKADSYDFTK